jgi:predicted ATPase
MVRRLFLHNYRGFVNFDLRFQSIAFLFGGNGTGKSSLLDALHGLIMVVDSGDIEAHFSADSRFRFASYPEQKFELEVLAQERMYLYRLELQFAGPAERPVVLNESLDCDGKPLYAFRDGGIQVFDKQGAQTGAISYDPHKGGLAVVESPDEDDRIAAFKDWAEQFCLLRLRPYDVVSEARKPALSLQVDGSNFAAWYETVANANTQVWFEYLQAMREVVPGLKAINLKPLHRAGKLLEVDFDGDSRNAQSFGLDELSEGQIGLLVYYAILYFCVKRGETVALDEPDNYVALAELEPLISALETAAEENHAQVFLISHHPEFYNRLADDSGRCIHFSRDKDGRFRAGAVDWKRFPGMTPAEVVARGWQGA